MLNYIKYCVLLKQLLLTIAAQVEHDTYECLWFALTMASPYASIVSDLFVSLWSTTNYTVVFMAMYYVTLINPKYIQQDNLSYTTISYAVQQSCHMHSYL